MDALANQISTARSKVDDGLVELGRAKHVLRDEQGRDGRAHNVIGGRRATSRIEALGLMPTMSATTLND